MPKLQLAEDARALGVVLGFRDESLRLEGVETLEAGGDRLKRKGFRFPTLRLSPLKRKGFRFSTGWCGVELRDAARADVDGAGLGEHLVARIGAALGFVPHVVGRLELDLEPERPGLKRRDAEVRHDGAPPLRRELENAAVWEEKNEALRRLGLRPIPNPRDEE